MPEERVISGEGVQQLATIFSQYLNRVRINGPFEWQGVSGVTGRMEEAQSMLDDLVKKAAPRAKGKQRDMLRVDDIGGCTTVKEVETKIEGYRTNPFNIKKEYESFEEALADLETADLNGKVPFAYKIGDIACITRYMRGRDGGEYFETEVYVSGREERFANIIAIMERTSEGRAIDDKRFRFPIEEGSVIVRKVQHYMFTFDQPSDEGNLENLKAHMDSVKKAFDTYVNSDS